MEAKYGVRQNLDGTVMVMKGNQEVPLMTVIELLNEQTDMAHMFWACVKTNGELRVGMEYLHSEVTDPHMYRTYDEDKDEIIFTVKPQEDDGNDSV